MAAIKGKKIREGNIGTTGTGGSAGFTTGYQAVSKAGSKPKARAEAEHYGSLKGVDVKYGPASGYKNRKRKK